MEATDIDRKIRHLDYDMRDIYTMLARIVGAQERHHNRLDEIAAHLEQLQSEMAARFGEIKDEVEHLDGHFEQLDAKVDTVIAEVEHLDGHFEQLDAKIDKALAPATEPAAAASP